MEINGWMGCKELNVFHSQMDWDIPSSMAEIDVAGRRRGGGFSEQCFQSVYSDTEVRTTHFFSLVDLSTKKIEW